MTTEGFTDKVKRVVAQNFDASFESYQSFEEKHEFFRTLALKLAENIGLETNSSVLDVGCGNGISAYALNKHYGCRVLGVDLSHKMIAAGRSLCDSSDIHLLVGDGEELSGIVGERRFDYVLYNASIFIFPDVAKTIDEGFKCLRSGGKIAFSFYPRIIGEGNADLLALAFHRLGKPPPRHLVITDYTEAGAALQHRCGNIRHHRWIRPLDIDFLQSFFSIPAQSASLFPKHEYKDRRNLVHRLFAAIGDMAGKGQIIWRMAEGMKASSPMLQSSGNTLSRR